jgi:PAS domain S-box-containing protein
MKRKAGTATKRKAGAAMRLHRWGVPTSVLLPLVPGAWIALRPVDEGSSVIGLLASVIGACWLGGITGGVASLVLAGFIYDLLVLPPRMEFAVTAETAPHLVAFVVSGGAVVALYGRLRLGWRRADRARLRATRALAEADRARVEAEQRADALAQRIDLIGPVLDRAPIGFAMVDADLRYRYVNQRLAEVNGVAAADHLGRRVAELFPAELAEFVESPVRHVLETGRVQPSVAMTVPGPDGDRHYLGSRYPVQDSGGRTVGVAISVLDVTQQVTLQESYRRALAELTATVQSSPIAIALVDTALRYKHVNRVFQQLSAAPTSVLAGRELLAADRLPAVVPGMCAEVLRTGQGRGAVDVPAGPDGTHLTVSCFPVRLDSGDVVAVAVILLDVTEQYRLAKLEAETASLRATAEMAFKLEEAQRLAGFGSWEMDLGTGEITWSKQMRAIAGEPEPFLAAGGRTLVHPDDRDRAARARQRLVDESVPYAEEFRLVRPDGTVIDVYATGEAIRDDDGRPVRVWGTLQDVTSQRASERAAQEAMRSEEQARTQLEAEHQALQMFVRAMLPARLPEIPDVQVAAAYHPVVERVDIGGDWYDSFPLPNGLVALSIGDVTGHDLRAATVMGQVRNAVRAYAIEDPDPGTVLHRVNALLCQLPELDLVTMMFSVYNPASHTLTWSNAGHPAPLLRRGGRVSTLSRPRGMILGAFGDGAHYEVGTVLLEPGDTVLWFTDGLVDNRAVDPGDALDTLVAVLAAGGAAPDRLLADVTDRMLASGPQEDDVCLLALHRSVQAEPHLRAVPDEPPPASRAA